MLTHKAVNPASVTADSNVSQMNNRQMPIPQNMAMVRDQQRMRAKGLVPHLHNPEVEAKRQKALENYWKKRRTAKEASKRYLERYGLRCVSARIPVEIVDAFNYICEKEGMCRAEVIARLLTGFIQRNSYPSTK